MTGQEILGLLIVLLGIAFATRLVTKPHRASEFRPSDSDIATTWRRSRRP